MPTLHVAVTGALIKSSAKSNSQMDTMLNKDGNVCNWLQWYKYFKKCFFLCAQEHTVLEKSGNVHGWPLPYFADNASPCARRSTRC